MKKIIAFSVLSFVTINLTFCQSWISSNLTTSDDNVAVKSSEIDNNGNIISLGYYKGTLSFSTGEELTSNGKRDYYVAKFFENGDLFWTQTIGGVDAEFSQGGIAVDENRNIYISGGFQNVIRYSESDSIESANAGFFDMFLYKFDENGNILWARNAGSSDNDVYSTSLGIDSQGDIILTGAFRDSIKVYNDTTLYTGDDSEDYFYGKFSSINGDLIWIKQIKSLNSSGSKILGQDVSTNDYYFTGIYIDSVAIGNDTIVSNSGNLDVHVLKTNLDGEVEWIQNISGTEREFSHAVTLDDENNIYVIGFYYSDTIYISSSDSRIDSVTNNNGVSDLFITKFNTEGSLEWIRTAGGIAQDQIFEATYFDTKVHVSGFFADTLNWGGIELKSTGIADTDMLTGSIDKQGNYREANSYAGRNNSSEEARGVFNYNDKLFTVLRSNSDLLILGEDVYTSTNGKFYIALGVIGCNPISIDNTVYTDVNTCYGDSTGSVLISASGGFEGPWQYSIDNGLTYQSAPLHSNLPAGDYQVVVIDKENCTQVGDLISLSQPDTIVVEVISTSDITADADGSIVVGAQGGTSPYTYTLQPGDVIQGFGTFMFSPGDSGRYVIEVNDQNLCGPVSTDTIEILDMSHVGINDIGGIALRVFPNPATDIVNIEMPLEASAVTMEVLSLTGQIVMSRQAYTTGGVLRETLDVSDLAQGMYMLRVNGQTLKSAIVVQ